ncbi:MAG TPA: GvpL/GvpF family gas vesicle protein [Pyrinomonadaceae bacterium]|nr:GvpL/GvpF family gas vesicle protein [Pyrinomonadaceae bacterium]
MRFYVYCLSDELKDEAVEGLKGVGGALVRVIAFGRLAAVVSELEDESVAVVSENLRAHNAVNAGVLARSTTLPFRFGTLATESRLAEYVAANEGSLVAALGRVRGCVEMGVKIMEKAKGKRQKAEDGSEEARSEVVLTDEASGAEAGASGVGRGTAFLLAKRREVLGDEAERRRAEEVAGWLAEGVSGLVRESSVRVNPSDALVVRAAHLVERARVEEYRGRVRSLGAERVELHFLTSGPWPPYSFGELRG